MSKAEVSSDTVSSPGAIASSSNMNPVELDHKVEDTNIVDWDGPQDVVNPQNWPNQKKWAHVIMVSLFALVT